MQSIYYPEDDILEIRFSDSPIVKEIAQDWDIVISYDEQGNIVEIVILDAKSKGLVPFVEKKAA